MAVKLAEALLRRKELQERLDRMKQINHGELFELKVKRVNVTDSVDEVTAGIPKMTFAQFSAEYNHNARSLRNCDAAIQNANWTTHVEDDGWMKDYEAPASE